MDPLSWALLMSICRRVRPAFVVLTFRPGLYGAAMEGRAAELRDAESRLGAVALPLGPLSPAEVAELAARWLGGAEPPAALRANIDSAQGCDLVAPWNDLN